MGHGKRTGLKAPEFFDRHVSNVGIEIRLAVVQPFSPVDACLAVTDSREGLVPEIQRRQKAGRGKLRELTDGRRFVEMDDGDVVGKVRGSAVPEAPAFPRNLAGSTAAIPVP